MGAMRAALLIFCLAIFCAAEDDLPTNGNGDFLHYDERCDLSANNENVVKGELCNRECSGNQRPLICHFTFTAEYYSVIGPKCGDCPNNKTECFEPECVVADGFPRGILSINRKVPGPSIEVCEGDTIVVDVENYMSGTGLTIHWHGLSQRGTQFMDGVPFLTQCPIGHHSSFRYTFKPEKSGTYFWHSHEGFQKMDGIVGPLIVRAASDNSRKLYDFDLSEHVIVLQDWKAHFFAEYMPGTKSLTKSAEIPDSLLINGRGGRLDPTSHSLLKEVPLAEFEVEAGKKYRFRLINAGCLVCPLRLAIEGHSLQVIAADSYDVEPVQVDSIVVMPGERYDFVLHANAAERIYWINVIALGPCEGQNILHNAILRYKNSDPDAYASNKNYPKSPLPEGRVLNVMNADCKDSGHICVDQLKLSKPSADIRAILAETDVQRLNLVFDMQDFESADIFGTGRAFKFFVEEEDLAGGHMNNVSLMMPPAPPLSQPNVLRDLCSSGSEKCCWNRATGRQVTDYRHCINIYSVPLGKVVEIIISDSYADDPAEDESHPIHIHGHSFLVMKVGSDKEKAHKAFLQSGSPSEVPAMKDTIMVPSKGFVQLRFRADNPGYWMVHCHVLPHSEAGMSAILKVGTRDDLPEVPEGFPTCGNFKPPINGNKNSCLDL